MRFLVVIVVVISQACGNGKAMPPADAAISIVDPNIIITDSDGVSNLVGDGTNLYWVSSVPLSGNQLEHQIKTAPASGGAPRLLISRGQHDPTALVIDGDTLYWAELIDPASNDGAVMSMPTAGGAVTLVASGLVGPGQLAIGPSNIYFVTGSEVRSMPKSAGAASTHVTDTGVDNVSHLVLQGTTLILLDYAHVMSAPAAGGPPRVLQMAINNSSGLAANTTSLFVNADNGQLDKRPALVEKIDPVSGVDSVIQSYADRGTSSIVADDTDAFWIVEVPHAFTITRLALASATMSTFQQVPAASQLVLNPSHVYWVASDGTAIARAPR
ncbi:MAG: putative secreted protein [Myxococcales bacterium]|nr:putative secreted protein [Myxococcales bacterium]